MQVTPHWTDRILAAALDPSGGGEIGASARAHAAECEVCGTALGHVLAAEDGVHRLLQALDHPVPPIGMPQIMARALENTTVRQSHAPNLREGVHVRRHVQWGIGLLLLGGGAAAATVPRSPLHQLIVHLFTATPSVHVPLTASQHVVAAPVIRNSSRSVAIVPRGPATVVFQVRQTAGVIRLLPTSGPHLTVRGSGDGAAYTVGENVIMIGQANSSSLSYDIELPSLVACPDVRIRVGDHIVYSRTHGHVQTEATPDAQGRYTVSFARIAG